MHDPDTHLADDVAASKQLALRYVAEAFAEAERDGLDEDCVVHAALFAAFQHLVEIYGEEPTAAFAEGLPSRVRNGAFTTGPRH